MIKESEENNFTIHEIMIAVVGESAIFSHS